MLTRVIALGLGLALLAPALADGPPSKAAARDVLKKYQDALVSVKLVIKVGTRELQVEVAGTVLSPEGLTVVSDANSNPGRMLAEDGGTEVTDVQILLKDGRELPAKFVLRDRDLDLAFVMPNEKGLKLTHVTLEKGPVPDVLDDLVFIHRLGRNLNREVGVALGSVSAVVKKPRTLLVPEASNVSQFLGCPVFDAKGRAVGLVVSRRGAGGGRLSLFGQSVVVPAEDVQQVAGQVGKDKEDDK